MFLKLLYIKNVKGNNKILNIFYLGMTNLPLVSWRLSKRLDFRGSSWETLNIKVLFMTMNVMEKTQRRNQNPVKHQKWSFFKK